MALMAMRIIARGSIAVRRWSSALVPAAAPRSLVLRPHTLRRCCTVTAMATHTQADAKKRLWEAAYAGEEPLPIVKAGDPVLRQPALKVPPELLGSEELMLLVERMVVAMRSAPGVGLAAPQVGVPYQVLVMEDRQEYIARLEEGQAEAMEREPFGVLALVNPKLTPLGGGTAVLEGGAAAGGSSSAAAQGSNASGGGGGCSGSSSGSGGSGRGTAGGTQEGQGSGAAAPAGALPGARFFEGCLSVPGYQALVERYRGVLVEAVTPEGATVSFRARAWQARILQHECDHLQGVLYIDRMLSRSFCSRDLLPARALLEDMPPPGPCFCSHSLSV